MRVKRNEEKSYIKFGFQRVIYVLFCFIFMFLILLEWFYKLGRQSAPQAMSWLIFTTRAATFPTERRLIPFVSGPSASRHE